MTNREKLTEANTMRIYRDIIKTSWHILWQQPWLWPLGLLTAIAGSSGEYGSLVSSVDRLAQQANVLEGLRNAVVSQRFLLAWNNFTGQLAQQPGLVLSVLLLGIAITLIIIWLVTVSQAALIAGIGAVDAGEQVSFTTATATGAKKFWPLFYLNLLAKFVTYLIMALAFIPFLITYLAGPVASGSFDSLILISFIIFVPFALVISFILKYAAIAVVLEGRSWWTSLKEAINLFFRNWLVSLEMAVLLFVVNMVVSLVVYVLIPNSLSVDIFLLAARANIISLLRILPSAVLLIAAGAWLSTFQYAAWTILFRRLRGGNIVPKLIRAVDEIPAYLERWFWPSPAPVARPAPRRRR